VYFNVVLVNKQYFFKKAKAGGKKEHLEEKAIMEYMPSQNIDLVKTLFFTFFSKKVKPKNLNF